MQKFYADKTNQTAQANMPSLGACWKVRFLTLQFNLILYCASLSLTWVAVSSVVTVNVLPGSL